MALRFDVRRMLAAVFCISVAFALNAYFSRMGQSAGLHALALPLAVLPVTMALVGLSCGLILNRKGEGLVYSAIIGYLAIAGPVVLLVLFALIVT